MNGRLNKLQRSYAQKVALEILILLYILITVLMNYTQL